MNLLSDLRMAFADWRVMRKQRRLYARMRQVGSNVYICLDTKVSGPEYVIIGSHTFIGHHCNLDACGGLIIGSGVVMSNQVDIWTQNHNLFSEDLRSLPYDRRYVNKPVEIGDNAFVGARTIITPGVKIGEGAVIGAGSVISRDVPPLAVVGGNPFRIIRYRDAEQYQRLKSEGRIYLKLNYNYDISSRRIALNDEGL